MNIYKKEKIQKDQKSPKEIVRPEIQEKNLSMREKKKEKPIKVPVFSPSCFFDVL